MTSIAPVLTPPAVRPHVSVAKLSRYWYVACTSRELRDKPVARTVIGIPLVLFRGKDGAGALLDRCPHRGVPLAVGKVVGGTLQCPYHGWRFDGRGQCVAIPGHCGTPEHRGREATAFPVIEREGFVWVWCEPETAPTGEPPSLGAGPGYASVPAQMTFEGTMHAVAENALDVPHTAFLHGGLFRTSKKANEITCRVTRTRDRVQCQYIGEPAPKGLIGRLLAPGGGTVEHYDRFILPSLTQVEYKLGDKAHVSAWQALTPESDFVTRVYAVAHFKIPLVPSWLVKLVVGPVARHILRQDRTILRLQTANTHLFGGERYVSTEIDLLGPHIWHLLKMAERGESAGEEHVDRDVSLMV